MVSKSVVLLALSTAALAHPQRHQHFHHGPSQGTGVAANPTGGIFASNATSSTNSSGIGAGSPDSSIAVLTVTVLPLPASSGSSLSSPAAVAAVASAAGEVAAAASTSSTCTSSLTITLTSTSTEFTTVTAASDAGSFASAGGFFEDSTQTSSDTNAVYTSVSSTSLASAAPSVSGTSVEDLEVPGSSVSFTSVPTVSAGAFFGAPSYSFSFGGGASSAAGFSSVQSVVPTTLATVTTSQAASSAASSSPATSSAPASSSTPSTGGSSGKKGLSYNTASLTDAFSGTGMTWAYNWAASAGGTLVSGVEYVPMLWGLGSTSGWASAAASAISSGSSHLLSFNEPDLSTQSNIDPSTAATNHITYMNPLAGQAQIGSPAVTNGVGSNPPMGTTWLQQFFDACNGECKVNFVAFHWYGSATDFASLQSQVQDIITTANNNGVDKVWLTEFGASGSDDEVASFLDQALPWLDSQSAVERYAYFMCSDGILLSGNSVSSPVGTAYVSS